jgi:neutral amino acid transport system ATP-binding protein
MVNSMVELMPNKEVRATPGVPILEVDNVTCHFGGVRALNGASFVVPPGFVTGLIGPNGAGKSTLINVISGAVALDGGRVLFKGSEVQGSQPHEMAAKGLIRIYQHSTEFGAMTVLENLLVAAKEFSGSSFWVSIKGKFAWRATEQRALHRARGILDRLELREKENDFAKSLSGGQKRLLELARALMAEPDLLILDEPLAGVNPTLGRKIITELERLRNGGMSILLVEHDLGVVERLCDTIVVMADGKVIAMGDMSFIRSQREVVDAYLSR